MEEIKNTKISRAYSKAAGWQITVSLFIAGVALLVYGIEAAISAMAGGGAVIVGAYTGMLLASRPNKGTPSGVLIALLKGEALKVLITAALLFVLFKFYRGLVPLSLIVGLAGSALASGAGLRAMNNENDE